ncbi:hypothetical protein SLS62_010816 [Diatrype stigma]|uniref:Uncharacterized protein n=1 Tax=Diatrype stigma TaxID=117547 RepID=A0AAN9YHF7_9PEZI
MQSFLSRQLKPEIARARGQMVAQGTALPPGLDLAQSICALLGLNYMAITQPNNAGGQDSDGETDGGSSDGEADGIPSEAEDDAGVQPQASFPAGRGKGGGKRIRKTPVLHKPTVCIPADQMGQIQSY